MTSTPRPAADPKPAKIDHTPCYEQKLHPATPAGRSLCRTIHAEGRPLSKKSFADAAKKAAAPKAAPAKKATPAKAPKPTPEAEPFGDDPFDEADATA